MNVARDRLDATRALIEGRLDAAERLIADLLAANADDAPSHLLAARLAAARRDFAGERTAIERAVAADPDDGQCWAMLARSLARHNDLSGTLDAIEGALACAPLDDVAAASVATAWSHFGRHREAADLLGEVAARGTRNPAIHFNLGNYRKFLGDVAGARHAFEAALALAPDYPKAHASLASLGDEPLAPERLDALETLRARTADPRVAIHLCHALSKQYEALGRYADAWAVLTEGKAALRAVLPHRSEELPAVTEQLRRTKLTLPPAEAPGASSPLFIVGLPRTGTTVLDRIVSNSPDVVSIGESLHLMQLLKIAAGSRTTAPLDAELIALLENGAALREAGEAYAAYARGLAGPGRRPLNKFHLHVLHVGHIIAALPDARILCLVRDPFDTIVGNYRQLFEFDTPTYAWSLDIGDAARFYAGFRRLVDHWQQLAPDRFRCVRYEELVHDPEGVAAPLFEFCGLAWDPAFARIEANDASVATASAVQVREPIHSRHVGRWRAWSRELEPARDIVAPWLG